MPKSAILLSLLVFFAPCVMSAAPPDAFVLVKKSEALSLFERWFVNEEGESVRELKAVFSVRSAVGDVKKLLTNASRGREWNHHAKEFKVRYTTDTNVWYSYARYALPWPFGDQDCWFVNSCDSHKADSALCVRFSSAPASLFPPHKNITRITGARGMWVIERADERSTRIVYTISTNRNQLVPRWVADPVIRNNLFNTMLSFKSILETT